MGNLLETVLDAHGGLERWNQLDAVSARLAQGGALWTIKGQEGVLADVFVRANLHQERESHHPFGAPERRSVFTPQRVAIETTAGEVLEALDQPRASFAGHALETPWTTLQLAYFVGTAMWTYLTQPFTYALAGFETTELDPWQEKGERWRRLRVTWPGYLATHNAEQTLYVGEEGLFRRHDYNIEIAGGTAGAHYISDYTKVAGIMIPTKHRIFPRSAGGQALGEPLDRRQRDRVHITAGMVDPVGMADPEHRTQLPAGHLQARPTPNGQACALGGLAVDSWITGKGMGE